MNNQEWKSMNDQDFEAALGNSFAELPPESIVEEITPWKKAMNRVLIGMALRALSLNFLCLDYILPTIGIVLSILGYRALRRENKWFHGGYILTGILGTNFFPWLILNTTIIPDAYLSPTVNMIPSLFSLLLTLMEFIFLRSALRAVKEKAGLPPKVGGATALIFWYMLLCVLALLEYNGLIIPFVMIVGYILIIRNLFRLSKEMDEAGYSVQAAPVRIPDKALVITLVSVLFIGCLCGYLFGGSYPMNWTQVSDTEHSKVEDIKADLIALGFPEYVLNDLKAEDIAACDGALQVITGVDDHPMNNGREITTQLGSGENRYTKTYTVYDVKELRITGVGVKVPGEKDKWIIFHHFLWTTDPGFYGTESVQLWPAYKNHPEAYLPGSEVTGRVLCDMYGKTYCADYYSLGEQTFTSGDIIYGEQTKTDVFATFSLPPGSEHQRGYVAYSTVINRDEYIIDSWVNYTHQKNPLQYPVKTAMKHRMTNFWNESVAFTTVQDALQF